MNNKDTNPETASPQESNPVCQVCHGSGSVWRSQGEGDPDYEVDCLACHPDAPQAVPVDTAALAETKVLPRFPGYREMGANETIADADMVIPFGFPLKLDLMRPTECAGCHVGSEGVGRYYRPIPVEPDDQRIDRDFPDLNPPIEPVPHTTPQAPKGSSPKAPAPVADDRPQSLLYDNLLVVWRDNGECLITTRKYPDDTGVNGPQCWPRGISGNYLATHCRAPIFHRSALDIVTGPAKIDASKILCDLGAAQIQVSTLTDALSAYREVMPVLDRQGMCLGNYWISWSALENDNPVFAKNIQEWRDKVAALLESPALVQALKGGGA